MLIPAAPIANKPNPPVPIPNIAIDVIPIAAAAVPPAVSSGTSTPLVDFALNAIPYALSGLIPSLVRTPITYPGPPPPY